MDRHHAAHAAEEILLHSSLFGTSQVIACFIASAYEFNCFPLIHLICSTQKKCLLPALSKEHEKKINFVSYHPGDVLECNRYQLLEPVHAEDFPPSEIDLVLMPLVGFDLSGNRLGMGGGYYDRTFHFLRERTFLERKPFLLGVAYELQKCDQLPCDEWDVRMDGVLTEKELYLF